MKTIVSISGTSRPDNYTSRAVAIVDNQLRKAGVQVEPIDARELSLPFPGHEPTDDSVKLRRIIGESSAVVLATPEYHGTFCAMTKLIIENLGFPSALKDKPVALIGVASGRIGAIKSLEQLRGVCSHVGAIVLPKAVSIAGVRKAFNDAGECTDEGVEAALRGVADSLLGFLKEYVCPKQILESMIREDGPTWIAEV